MSARSRSNPSSTAPWSEIAPRKAMRVVAGILSVALAALLVTATVLILRKPGDGLTTRVLQAMPESGVDHAVTAVLLNFRGYDTWLELGVLLVAAMGTLALRHSGNLIDAPAVPGAEHLLRRMTGVFVPIMILAAGYLLWRGSHRPGGAFQAGAMLTAAAVLLRLSGRDTFRRMPGPLLRLLLIVGFATFGMLGIIAVMQGNWFLQYPPAHAGWLIFTIELVATISIAVTLWAVFAGSTPRVSSATTETE